MIRRIELLVTRNKTFWFLQCVSWTISITTHKDVPFIIGRRDNDCFRALRNEIRSIARVIIYDVVPILYVCRAGFTVGYAHPDVSTRPSQTLNLVRSFFTEHTVWHIHVSSSRQFVGKSIISKTRGLNYSAFDKSIMFMRKARDVIIITLLCSFTIPTTTNDV